MGPLIARPERVRRIRFRLRVAESRLDDTTFVALALGAGLVLGFLAALV